MDRIIEVIAENFSSLMALLGVIIGAWLTFRFTSSLKKKELDLRLREKLLDRRIDAHEQVARFAQSLGSTVSVGVREDDKYVSMPAYMIGIKEYQEWSNHWGEIVNSSNVWLMGETSEELALIGMYLRELEKILDNTDTNNLWVIGVELTGDLGTFSMRLGNACQNFFSREALRSQFREARTIYTTPFTAKRRESLLNQTKLFSNREHIEWIARATPSEIEKGLNFKVLNWFQKEVLEAKKDATELS